LLNFDGKKPHFDNVKKAHIVSFYIGVQTFTILLLIVIKVKEKLPQLFYRSWGGNDIG